MASWMLVLIFHRAGLNMYSVAGKLSINYGGTELNYSRMHNMISILLFKGYQGQLDQSVSRCRNHTLK